MFGIVICHCPRQHTIYTTTFDGEKISMGSAIEVLNHSLEDAIEREVLKPFCKVCGSPKGKWQFTARMTGYADLPQLLCAIDELKKRRAEEALRLM